MISKDSIVLKQLRNAQSINRESMLKNLLKDEEVQDWLVDIMRLQMRRSETKIGLMPEYADSTLKEKDFSEYMGKMPHYDLYDTGKFQDEMIMRIEGSSVMFDSKDPKTNDILDMLDLAGMPDPDENIFDYNNKHLKEAQKAITPFFFKNYHQALNK